MIVDGRSAARTDFGAGPLDRIALLAHATGIGDALHMMPTISHLIAMGYDVHVSCRDFWEPIIRVTGATIIPRTRAVVGFVPESLATYSRIISLTAWTFDHEQASHGDPFADRIDQFAAVVDPSISLVAPYPYREILGTIPGAKGHASSKHNAPRLATGLSATESTRTYPYRAALVADLRRLTPHVTAIGRDAGAVEYASIGELITAILKCTLVIGVDSGIANLAAALGIPTLGIFGPTDPTTILHQFRRWAGNNSIHHITPTGEYQCELPCNTGHGRKLLPECRNTAKCLLDVAPAEIIKRATAILSLHKTMENRNYG